MMYDKIKLSQFKIVLIASAVIISAIGLAANEIPQADATSDPFVGEILFTGHNFAPRGWASCNGQLLAISQNDALFSLIGTVYGGDGETTFGLPDMRGRIPIHEGTGPGLSPHPLGQKAGSETVTLTVNQIPSHSHTGQISVNNEDVGNTDSPADNYLTKQWRRAYHDTSGMTTNDVLAGASIGNAGGSQPHTNMMPYQVVNCNIALVGTFPTRN